MALDHGDVDTPGKQAEQPKESIHVMTNEQTHSILSCPDIDQAFAFYETIDFQRITPQERPNLCKLRNLLR